MSMIKECDKCSGLFVIEVETDNECKRCRGLIR